MKVCPRQFFQQRSLSASAREERRIISRRAFVENLVQSKIWLICRRSHSVAGQSIKLGLVPNTTALVNTAVLSPSCKKTVLMVFFNNQKHWFARNRKLVGAC